MENICKNIVILRGKSAKHSDDNNLKLLELFFLVSIILNLLLKTLFVLALRPSLTIF